MLVTLFPMITLASLVQPEKRLPSRLVILFPMLTLVRLVQSLKAKRPMLVTLSGIVTLVRPDCSKACSPMLVTLLGMVMLVRLVQLPKALPPMLVTLSGIVMLGNIYAKFLYCLFNRINPKISFAPRLLVSPRHPWRGGFTPEMG